MIKNIKWKSHIKLLAVWGLAAAMVLPAASTALAAGRLEVDREGGLRLEYQYSGQPLTGAEISLYRVADITESGAYVLSGDFRDYPVRLENLDNAGWKAAANTLETYVIADKRVPIKTGLVDQRGALDFGTMQTGLYLFAVKDLTLGGNRYHSDAFLISLPSLDEHDAWYYDIDVRPKSTESEPVVPHDKTLTVIKEWNDRNYENNRPQEITVSLLRDGAQYDQVKLTEANYWRHEWKDLENGHEWRVVETGVPSSYTVTYTDNGVIYTVTNTYRRPGGDNPGGGGTPPLVTIPEEDPPLGNITPPPTELDDNPVPLAKLPQTGLLWWPVPFLAMGGLLLIGFGYRDYCNGKRRKDEK